MFKEYVILLYSYEVDTKQLEERACLNRRRLEEAHQKYCLLKVYKRYPSHFKEWKISVDIQKTIEEVTPSYYRGFSEVYMCKFKLLCIFVVIK